MANDKQPPKSVDADNGEQQPASELDAEKSVEEAEHIEKHSEPGSDETV